MLNWFARRIQELQKAKRNEQGFTLIELLVVVTIIGILAAIAIPVFLNQRGKAQQSAVESDARTAGSAISVCLTETNTCNTADILKPYGYTPSRDVNAPEFTGSGATTKVTVTHKNNANAKSTFDAATGNISATP